MTKSPSASGASPKGILVNGGAPGASAARVGGGGRVTNSMPETKGLMLQVASGSVGLVTALPSTVRFSKRTPTMLTVDDLPCKLIGFFTYDVTLRKSVSLMIDWLAAVRQLGGSSELSAMMLESAASIRMSSK